MIPEIFAAIAAFGLLAFSLRWNWWRPAVQGIPVLMYHKIGTAPKGSKLAKLWVSPAMFARQVDLLLKRGYTPVLLRDLAAATQKDGKALPDKPVLITFDDGYRNNYTEAFRILKEKGAKGNIFVTYNSIERANEWHNPDEEPWQTMLSWDEMKEMLASGVMDIGSHTMNHANLAALELSNAAWELRESKKRLQDHLGIEILAFAYPYGAGAFVSEIRALVFEAGYLLDFSVKQGIAQWPWSREDGALKRILVRGDDNMLDFSLNISRGKARF